MSGASLAWTAFLLVSAAPQETRTDERAPVFRENVGQHAEGARFVARAAGAALFVAEDGIRIVLAPAEGSAGASVFLRVEGTERAAVATAAETGPANEHHLRGREPAAWKPSVPSADRVTLGDTTRGVGLVLHRRDGRLAYDLELAPGSDAEAISFRVEGAESMAIDRAGRLAIATAAGELLQDAPIAWQENAAGARARLPVRCVLLGADRFGFRVFGRDPAQRLTIDPALVYSSFLGSLGLDGMGGVATDAAGATYLAGSAGAADFPSTPGSYDPTFNGGLGTASDAVVLKLDAAKVLVAATFLGSATNEGATFIGVKTDGSMTVGGAATDGLGFPTTPGAFLATPVGAATNPFIARLDPTGRALLFSTFLGGTESLSPAFATDAAGATHVSLVDYANDFPATPGAYKTASTFRDTVVAKLNDAGSALAFATLLGGSGPGIDRSRDIAVGADLAPVVVGDTSTTDFPTTSGVIGPSATGWGGGFVSKIAPDGTSLVFSSYLGGPWTYAQCVDVAADGSIVVGGLANVAASFPTTPDAFNVAPAGGGGTFVTRMSADGTSLQYSTFLSFGASVSAIDAGPSGEVTLLAAHDAPLLSPNALSTAALSPVSVVNLVRLSPTGAGLVYGSLFGGSSLTSGIGLDVGASGLVTIVGSTRAPDFPATPDALQPSLLPSRKTPTQDGFLATFLIERLPAGVSAFGAGTPGCFGPHVLHASTALAPGEKNFQLLCDAPSPATPGLLILSDRPIEAGADPFGIGLTLHVGLAGSLVVPIDLLPTPDGKYGRAKLSIPSLPSFVGTTLYAQAVWSWSLGPCAPSPFALSSSNGLAMTVQPPVATTVGGPVAF